MCVLASSKLFNIIVFFENQTKILFIKYKLSKVRLTFNLLHYTNRATKFKSAKRILKLLKASQGHPGKFVDVIETLAKCISDCMFNKRVLSKVLSK